MRRVMMLIVAASLGACSAEPTNHSMKAFDAQEEAAPPSPATGQRIAYVYRLGFALDPAAIPTLQSRHEGLCRRLARGGCRVLRSSREASEDGSGGSASMAIEIDARLARRFTAALEQAAAGAGARTSDSAMESEDVTKATVDADARLRQRSLLVARLTELLRTRQGSVGDLVAAEKALADAQEELDAARANLALLSRRVATSTIEVRYAAKSGGAGEAFDSPAALLDESREQLLRSLRALLSFAVVSLPWIALLWLSIWSIRRFRRARARRAGHG